MRKLKDLKLSSLKDEQLQLIKGGGKGNFHRMEDKKCPPPWEDGIPGNQ